MRLPRDAIVCVRLSEWERARLVGLALSKGLTVSELLRRSIRDIIELGDAAEAVAR